MKAAGARAGQAVKKAAQKAEDKAAAEKIEVKKTAAKVTRKAKDAAEKVETAAKKTAARAKAAKTEMIIQSPMGGNITPEEVLAKVGEVDQVYIRVDENKAYWVKGEESGSVDLW